MMEKKQQKIALKELQPVIRQCGFTKTQILKTDRVYVYEVKGNGLHYYEVFTRHAMRSKLPQYANVEVYPQNNGLLVWLWQANNKKQLAELLRDKFNINL